MVGLEQLKGSIEVTPEFLGRASHGFRRDRDLVALIGKRLPNALFTGRVRPRRIEERHTTLERATNEIYGNLLGASLNRQGPEGVLGSNDPRGSECDVAHGRSLRR